MVAVIVTMVGRALLVPMVMIVLQVGTTSKSLVTHVLFLLLHDDRTGYLLFPHPGLFSLAVVALIVTVVGRTLLVPMVVSVRIVIGGALRLGLVLLEGASSSGGRTR